MNDIQILRQVLNGYHLNDKELSRAIEIHRLMSVHFSQNVRLKKHESGTFNLKNKD